MVGILVDVYEDTIRKAYLEDELEEFYKLLQCDCIDIVVREVDGVSYDIVCDDEGLLKSGFIVSAVDEEGEPQLVGNLLFLHHDEEGNLTGIQDPSEIDGIRRRIAIYAELEKPETAHRVVVLDSWR